MMAPFKKNNQIGFTLIEIMVVIAIIGILAAVAVPEYVRYRHESFVATVKSDIHSFANAEEAYFVKNSLYTTSPANLTSDPYGAKLSSNSSVVTISSADPHIEYQLTIADASRGIVVIYDSDAGGLQ